MIFAEGIRNGRISINPARLVRLRKEDNARIRFLTYKEEALIRKHILERCPCHEPAFTVALETGMRMSEQHFLDWDDVQIGRRQIELGQTKNGSRRIVVLNEKAIKVLEVCAARRTEKTSRVFLSRFGSLWIARRRGSSW
jgi:integrase